MEIYLKEYDCEDMFVNTEKKIVRFFIMLKEKKNSYV